MWEYVISFDDDVSSQYFKCEIENIIKKYNGIVTILNSNTYSKVLIAIPIIERFKFHNILREKIAETILVKFKSKYILSKLEFDLTPTEDMQIFLKALVVFDTDIDKEIIMERLKFDSNLVVSSFVNFKLSFLKRKWQELISLANDNSMYLLSKDSFLELIKFLISNLEHRYYVVNVFLKQNCYFLCDTKGNKISDYLLKESIVYDDNNLLVSLVSLNPEKIILHCNNLVKDKILNSIYTLFSNRVEIRK